MKHATEKFQRVAGKQDTSIFDFKDEVKQVWHDFPETKDTVFFFNADSGAKLVYPEKGARTEKKNARRAARKVANLRRDNIKSRIGYRMFGLPGERGSYTLTRLNDGLRLISHVTKKSTQPHVAANAPTAQETMFVFDHELGHALTPLEITRGGDSTLLECIGDAYATLRHFQRYGVDSPVIDAIVANRAFDLVFRGGEYNQGYGRDHFTSPVTEAILAQRYDIDWNSLTPQQTIDKALQFAQENQMDTATLVALDESFASLHGRVEEIIKKKSSAPFQALAEQVLSTESPQLFKYGAAALGLYMDRQIAGVVLEGSYWESTRRKLAEKQKAFSQQKVQAAPQRGINLRP